MYNYTVAVADSAAVRTDCLYDVQRPFCCHPFVPFHGIERASKLIAIFVSYFSTNWAGPLGTIKS